MIVGRPELLAPAGTWDCARAAVANGADAVYFGLPRFNARMRAENFREEEIGALMRFLHEHNVKGYAAFNVLVFTDELTAAEEELLRLREAEVDAVIVQDIGIALLAAKLGVPVHASTQMTITSPEGVRFARSLGIERCVLARETSLRELERFPASDAGGLPLEVFVHGALCVAYSGQCLTSESLGQRNANRGECAQACRLPYRLVVDGEVRELGDKRYLLSPQDLAAVDEIPRLIDLGVKSFKIEGRLKSPEYVAATTRVYRKAIDEALAAQDDGGEAVGNDTRRYELEMAFSRGLFSGWMQGVNHQELVHARFGKKRGAFVGRVKAMGADWLETDGEGHRVNAGDGIVIDTGGDTDREQGGRVIAVRKDRLIFEPDRLDMRRVGLGARIWKTDDPRLNKMWRETFAEVKPRMTEPLRLVVAGRAGETLRLEARPLAGTSATVESGVALQRAEKKPLTTETLRDQLGRLGGTPFHLAEIENRIEGEVILPFSELAAMRRRLVENLVSASTDGPAYDAAASGEAVVAEWLREIAARPTGANGDRGARMSVLCRTEAQIEGAIEAGADVLMLDFEDVRRFSGAVKTVRASGAADLHVLVATPRIQKAGEDGYFKLIRNTDPDGILIRNPGAIEFFRGSGLELVGDFSLNAANPITAARLMDEGLSRLTASYDLNIDQLCALLRATPSDWFEIVLHQHMPMFHMEHCVFAAFMSKGRDSRDCGRPCEKHRVSLKDRVGQLHPLRADVGCRNTLFNAQAQTGAEFIGPLCEVGVRVFRIELLDENAAGTQALIENYRALIKGEMEIGDLMNRVGASSQLGVTGGTLTVL